MTTTQALLAIAVMALVTFATRLIPFAVFGRGGHPPKTVLYLGKVLPPAIIAMLIVYCLRETPVLTYPYGIPQAIAVIVVALLHIWKHNDLLSIFGGTLLYMALVQYVF